MRPQCSKSRKSVTKTSSALQAQGDGSCVLKRILLKENKVTRLMLRREMSLVTGGPRQLAYMMHAFEELCLAPHWTVTMDNSLGLLMV